MPTTDERPIVIDIVDSDGTGHVYVHGVGSDGNRLMPLWRDGRLWTVELYDGGSCEAANLPDLAYTLAHVYAATVCRAGVAVVEDETGGRYSMRVPLAFVCDYGQEPATRVTGDNEALCATHARKHYGADWTMDTRQLTPIKAERHARTGRFERY